jgi:hypothetical protein
MNTSQDSWRPRQVGRGANLDGKHFIITGDAFPGLTPGANLSARLWRWLFTVSVFAFAD